MKRFLIFAAGFAILGGAFAYLLKTKSSYVLLTYESFALETSLWFFIFALVLVYFLFNVLLGIFLKLYRPGRRFNLWAENRRAAAAKKDFYQALLEYQSGFWEKALQKFRHSIPHIDRPVVACLYAARCAQKLGRKDIREALLHEAAQLEPKSALAIGIVRAELMLEEGNRQEARKLLEDLQRANAGNPQLMELLDRLSVSPV